MRIRYSVFALLATTYLIGCSSNDKPGNTGKKDLSVAQKDFGGDENDLADAPDLKKARPDLTPNPDDDLAGSTDDMAASDEDMTADTGDMTVVATGDMTVVASQDLFVVRDDIALSSGDLSPVQVDMATPPSVCAGGKTTPVTPLTTFHAGDVALNGDNPSVAVLLPNVPLGYAVNGVVRLKAPLPDNINTSARIGSIRLVDAFSGASYELDVNQNYTWTTDASGLSFAWTLPVPAGKYYVSSQIYVYLTDPDVGTFSGYVASIRTEPTTTEVCNDTVTITAAHDHLPPLKARKVTVGGLDKQLKPATGFDGYLNLETVDGKLAFHKTFTHYGLTSGTIKSSAIFENFMLPNDDDANHMHVKATFSPQVTSVQTPRTNATNGYQATVRYNLGDATDFLSIVKDASATLSNAFSVGDETKLALTDTSLKTVTGTITDSSTELFRPWTPETTDTPSVVNHLFNCQATNDFTRLYAESNQADLFTDAKTFSGWVRNGIECATFGGFTLRVPHADNLPTTVDAPLLLDRENDLLVLITEPLTATINGTLGKDYTIPTLAADVSREIKVVDSTNAPLVGYTVAIESAYFGQAPDRYALRANVITDASGTATLHIVPGTYTITITK